MKTSAKQWASRLFAVAFWISAGGFVLTLVSHLAWIYVIARKPVTPPGAWAFYLGAFLPIVIWALWTWVYGLARNALRSPERATAALKRMSIVLTVIFALDISGVFLERVKNASGSDFTVSLVDLDLGPHVSITRADSPQVKETTINLDFISTDLQPGYLLPRTQGTMTLLLAALVFLLARSREEMELVV